MLGNSHHHDSHASDVLIPLIRAAATVGFAIAPCSLGFVIIAVSEQLIRSIMVGEDPEMLVSDLQKQYPHESIEAADKHAELVAQVVDLIDRPEQQRSPPNGRAAELKRRAWEALQKMPPCSRARLKHEAAAAQR